MGKGQKQSRLQDVSPNTRAVQTRDVALKTTTAIASDQTLGFKVRVLLYDFTSIATDPNSERRINKTTDEHYISSPYFTDAEVQTIKAAKVDLDISPPGGSLETPVGEEDAEPDHEEIEGASFDTALRKLPERFIEKRRASGDSRPCGPHHLAPMYASLFGIDLKELKEENFLRRLRKGGI